MKENVGSRFEDHVLWDRWRELQGKEEMLGGKRRKSPTSGKQMKKQGEPMHKEARYDSEEEHKAEEARTTATVIVPMQPPAQTPMPPSRLELRRRM